MLTIVLLDSVITGEKSEIFHTQFVFIITVGSNMSQYPEFTAKFGVEKLETVN